MRIVRDYGKYDRREAPQYCADAKGGESLTPDTALSGRAARVFCEYGDAMC